MRFDRDYLLSKLGSRAFVAAQSRFQKTDAVGAEKLGARLAMMLYKLDKKHRRRTYENLKIAFPEMDEASRQRLGLETYRHFGRVMGDFMRSPVRPLQEVQDSIVERVGEEHLDEAIARGKGVLLVCAHFGNWERYAQYLAIKGLPMSVVARDANDTGLDKRVREIREKSGVEVLSRGSSARKIITKLRHNELVGLLPDQNAGDAFVPFFGKMTGTVLGPAVLHQRTGASLISGFCVRVGPAQYRVEVFPIVDKNNTMEDPVEIMAELNAILEGIVRRYPEQYLWLHDRWKEARRRGLL